ncbi:hypothetical protein [Streptomyces sp. NBC_01589]|uniref:Thoeris anti-defense Tad2 family protein n=1 Tax=unclassified Streptomyces TaxID=2593676 RepID=UPI003864DB32
MDFSAAMEPLKDGRRRARRSWVQPGKYVHLEAASACITPDILEPALAAHLQFMRLTAPPREG